MKLYHLQACDKCRNAIKSLTDAGYDIDVHDVRADGLNTEMVEEIEAALGYEAIVNKRSTTWRGLSDEAKLGLTRDTAMELLVENPTLLKRPVIVHDGKYTVGWTGSVKAKYGL